MFTKPQLLDIIEILSIFHKIFPVIIAEPSTAMKRKFDEMVPVEGYKLFHIKSLFYVSQD